MARYFRLRILRTNAGLSQKELAEYLAIHQTTYSRYESGMRDLPIDLLVKLVHLYQISSDYIIGLTDIPAPLKKEH